MLGRSPYSTLVHCEKVFVCSSLNLNPKKNASHVRWHFSEPLDWHRHFSIAPSISVSDVSSLSFILPQFGGSRARRRQGEGEEGGPITAPSSSSSAPDQFAVCSSSSSPAVLRWRGRRRARAWPHLPHSSSPEDTAEFEVTATNLGRGKGKDGEMLT